MIDKWVKGTVIARNTSGFTRREIMDALKVAGRPPGALILDLTKSHRMLYKGWCHSNPSGWVSWQHGGTDYIADCHIRLRLADVTKICYRLRTGRGRYITVEAMRWQALALLLAHELDHWRQAQRDGKARCLQIQADRAALKAAKRLGLLVCEL